jgi:uncharacterized protein (TIGR03435 family)
LPTAAPTAQAQSIETRSPTVLDRPSAAAAEDPAKAIAYDVVSIHLNKSDSPGGSARSNPDGDVMVNQSLEGMIGPAYGVEPDQVYGLPAWVKTNRYDMQFKVAAEDIPAYGKLHGRESMRMLQAVLEDRLKLKAHLGSKEVPMYNLVIAKDGPKLHQAKDGDTYADGIKMPDGTPVGSRSRSALSSTPSKALPAARSSTRRASPASTTSPSAGCLTKGRRRCSMANPTPPCLPSTRCSKTS